MDRDQLFVDLCLKSKLLTQPQVEECRKLQAMLSDNGFALPLSEIVAKKDLLNPHQVRLVNVGIRYEEQREVDVELGDFILRKGFLPIEKLNECLTAQEAPYKEGRHFPKLEDLLIQKGHLNAQQLHVILRAWEQLGEMSRIGKPGSSPRMPKMQPAVPPPESKVKADAAAKAAAAPPKPPVPLFDKKTLETGLNMDTLKVNVRRSKLKEGTGEIAITVLELQGSLDGHSSRKLDVYVNSLIDSDVTRLVADCRKLEYISSAGIGVLTGAVKRCRDAKGDLRICNVNEKVSKIMKLVGIESIIRLYADDRGAIMSFKYS